VAISRCFWSTGKTLAACSISANVLIDPDISPRVLSPQTGFRLLTSAKSRRLFVS
jgi:hypothetical protein